jgi:methylated-DNA-[protein]-cysteine S-methyltransferase
MMELRFDEIPSAIGTLVLVTDGVQLCALDYVGYEQRMTDVLKPRFGNFHLKKNRNPCGFSSHLRAYLHGELSALDAIPVSTGGTPFQQRVWAALRTISPGTVMSYGEMAAQLGQPRAFRAVGAANALNPIAIVIPCHRLVGTNGSLTGYAGGLERKRWLLEHEGVNVERLNRNTESWHTSSPGVKSPLIPL